MERRQSDRAHCDPAIGRAEQNFGWADHGTGRVRNWTRLRVGYLFEVAKRGLRLSMVVYVNEIVDIYH